MDDLVAISRSELGETLFSVCQDAEHELRQWLDLSTVVSPWSWPVPHVPELAWQKVVDSAELETAARGFYQSNGKTMLATQGVQQAIETIPKLIPATAVAIPKLGYDEHQYHWREAGHEVLFYRSFKELITLAMEQKISAAVVINPNNPTGVRVPKEKILELQSVMSPTGLLLIDEALIDADDSFSLASSCDHSNTIVLRSLSKFYGLAGMRLGFAMGSHPVLDELRQKLGLWPISAVAAHVAPLVFADNAWRAEQKLRLEGSSRQLVAQLTPYFTDCRIVDQGLFVTVFGPNDFLQTFYNDAKQAKVLVKYGQLDSAKAWLRFGVAKQYRPLRDLCEPLQ